MATRKRLAMIHQASARFHIYRVERMGNSVGLVSKKDGAWEVKAYGPRRDREFINVPSFLQAVRLCTKPHRIPR